MIPFSDENPRGSWEICPGKYCRQLHDGKIYKCPPLAYLPILNNKLELSPKWRPYLNYDPLDASCCDDELELFFDREEEEYCRMCSAYNRPLAKPSPIRMTLRTLKEQSQEDDRQI